MESTHRLALLKAQNKFIYIQYSKGENIADNGGIKEAYTGLETTNRCLKTIKMKLRNQIFN